MSLRVLVIPEDPTNNGYILKPLVQMVMAEVGRPRARISVLNDPRVRGYDHAMRVVRNDLALRYGFMDLWLFFPDADRAGAEAMSELEDHLLRQGVTLFCSPSAPEVEIYACVGYRAELGDSWETIRSNPRLKEEVFEPLRKAHGDPRQPGGGRRKMTESSMVRRRHFFRLCPEIARLRDRIAAHLDG